MLLTEEQARKEVCPLIRYCVNEVGVIQDKDAAIYQNQLCQGSDCKMGWRWGEPAIACRGFREEARTERGYCGAFGKPGV